MQLQSHDSNVDSEMMRPRSAPQVAAFLESIAYEGLGLPSVTIREVFDGNGRLAHGHAGADSPASNGYSTSGKFRISPASAAISMPRSPPST